MSGAISDIKTNGVDTRLKSQPAGTVNEVRAMADMIFQKLERSSVAGSDILLVLLDNAVGRGISAANSCIWAVR